MQVPDTHSEGTSLPQQGLYKCPSLDRMEKMDYINLKGRKALFIKLFLSLCSSTFLPWTNCREKLVCCFPFVSVSRLCVESHLISFAIILKYSQRLNLERGGRQWQTHQLANMNLRKQSFGKLPDYINKEKDENQTQSTLYCISKSLPRNRQTWRKKTQQQRAAGSVLPLLSLVSNYCHISLWGRHAASSAALCSHGW